MHININLLNVGGLRLLLTTVYVKHLKHEGLQVWNNLSLDAANNALPWVAAGDFNCTMYNNKRISGVVLPTTHCMVNWTRCLVTLISCLLFL